MTPGEKLKDWQTVLRKAGIRYRNPYQTRHTYASLLLSVGENPMWVASQMGHADWGMIRKRYGRWIPSVDLEVGEKANRISLNPGSDGDRLVTGKKGYGDLPMLVIEGLPLTERETE